MTGQGEDFPAGYVFVSGNGNKIAEYASYGFKPRTSGVDLPEVDADHRTVAMRKSLSAGPMTIIEDTALDVERAAFGVNVKWLQRRLPEFKGRRATTRIILAVNDGEAVSLFEASTTGTIVDASGVGHGFGYDPIFAPDGHGGLTMADLAAQGRKAEASARAKALRLMLAGKAAATYEIGSIAPWDGAWQEG